jgi:hypothetical protein
MSKDISGVGPIIIAAVAIIAALALIPTIFQAVGNTTLTRTVSNELHTFGPVTVLQGQAVSNVVVTNTTDGAEVPASNYTIVNYDVNNGVLRSYLVNKSGIFGGNSVNVSYTYEPLGYAKESGTRAIIPLIAIFAALAVAVLALIPAFRREVMDLIQYR